MIPSRHTQLGYALISLIGKSGIRRNFKELRYYGEFNDEGLPILLLSNHFSWWDGFIQIQLNNRYWNRKFHVMMLEEQLIQNKILNKAGAFSVRKGSRSILESLNYCTDILTKKENMLLLFPQGEIQSLYTHPFKFQQGIDRILAKQETAIHIIFNINLIDYLSNKKPSLSIYYKEYFQDQNSGYKTTEEAYNAFALNCLNRHTKQ